MKLRKKIIGLTSLSIVFIPVAAVVSCNEKKPKEEAVIYQTPDILESTSNFINGLSSETPYDSISNDIKILWNSLTNMYTESSEPNESVSATNIADLYIKGFSFSFIKKNIAPILVKLIKEDSIIKSAINASGSTEESVYQAIKSNWFKLKFKGSQDNPNKAAKKIGNQLWTLGDRMSDNNVGGVSIPPSLRGFSNQKEAKNAKWVIHGIAKVLKDDTSSISITTGLGIDL